MSLSFLSALISVAAGVIVSGFTLLVERKNNKRLLSVQYITDKRVDWIYALREELSNYISFSFYFVGKYILPDLSTNESMLKDLCRINKSIAKIRLLLNFSGERDQKILNLLGEIQNNINQDSDEFKLQKFHEDIAFLTNESQIYLKLEWERVKLEASKSLKEKKLINMLDEKADELEYTQKHLSHV